MKKAFIPVIMVALLAASLIPFFSTNVSAASEVTGTVYLAEGTSWNSADNTKVTLLDSSDVEISTFQTTAGGTFTFDLTAHGTYHLDFEVGPGFSVKIADGLGADKRTFNFNGSNISLVIVIGPASGYIAGKVTNENGDGLGGVNVQAINAVGVVRHDVTKSDGTYSISAPTGSWTVSASRSDYKGTDISVVVGDGASSTADFTMEKSTKTYVFGLDLPHTMMVAGLFLGLILVIIAAWYRRHVGKIIGEKPPEDVV